MNHYFFFFLQFIPQDGLLVSIYSFNFTWCYTIRWRQTAFFFESIIIQSIPSTTHWFRNESYWTSLESFIQPICSNNLNTVPLGEAHAWFRTVTVLFVWITKRHNQHPIKLLSFCMWKNKSFVQIRSTKPFGKNTQVRCPVASIEILKCSSVATDLCSETYNSLFVC